MYGTRWHLGTAFLAVAVHATFAGILSFAAAQEVTFDHIYSAAATYTIAAADSVIVIGTSDGRMLITQDGGDTWSERSVDVNSRTESLAFCPDGSLLAGTSANSLLVSSDRGESWRVVDSNRPATAILHCQDGLMLTAGKRSFVTASRDDGLTWSVVILDSLSGTTPLWTVGVDSSGGAQYVGFVGCLEFSCGQLYDMQPDTSWTAVESWNSIWGVQSIELRDSATVFVYGSDSDVYRTFDAAETWTQDWPIVEVTTTYVVNDTVTVAGNVLGLYLSLDGGNSFEKWDLRDLLVRDIGQDLNGRLLVSTSSGVWRSRDSFPVAVSRLRDVSEDAFAIYPNPFDDWIDVEVGSLCRDGDITVFDALGRLYEIVVLRGGDRGSFQTNEWPSGQYVFRYECFGDIIHGKAIKL